LTKLRVFISWSRILSPSLKFIFFTSKHCGLFPHRMDARDRHNGQRDNRTNERTDGRTDGQTDVWTKRRVASLRPSVRPFLRWSLTHRVPFQYRPIGWKTLPRAAASARRSPAHDPSSRLPYVVRIVNYTVQRLPNDDSYHTSRHDTNHHYNHSQSEDAGHAAHRCVAEACRANMTELHCDISISSAVDRDLSDTGTRPSTQQKSGVSYSAVWSGQCEYNQLRIPLLLWSSQSKTITCCKNNLGLYREFSWPL